MKEIIKKRFKEGDSITIYLANSEITGTISEIDDSCIIINSNSGTEEFLQYSIIQRFSKPISESSPIKNEEVKPISTEKTDEIRKDSSIEIPQNEDIENNPKLDQISNKNDGLVSQDLEEKKDKRPIKSNLTKPINDFSKLNVLLKDMDSEDNEKIIPARGIIHTFFSDRNFGFIADVKGNYDLYFNFHEVRDQSILVLLRGSTFKKGNIPVIYLEKNGYENKNAYYIQKPKTVKELFESASKKFESKEFNDANSLVDQVLYSFPNNRSAKNLKEKYKPPLQTYQKSIYSNSNFEPNYQKAKIEHTIHKNHQEALKYYFIALDKNEKRESCIKDISMLYIAMGEHENALKFIEKYERELPKISTNFNFLENIYSSLKQYEKAIYYIDLLLSDKSFFIKEKKSLLLTKKAFSFIKLNQFEKAKGLLEDAIKLQPDNSTAIRLVEFINNPYSEEFKSAIDASEFDSFGGGMSKFISDILSNYTEYHGIPPKVINAKNFTAETLASLRSIIDTAGKARPRERANYLLSEAKLMIDLEPEKDVILRSVIAKYCNAMALNHISENSSMDVIRFYYEESFSLESSIKSISRQIVVYLGTFKFISNSLLEFNNNPDLDYMLNQLETIIDKEIFWNGILSIFILNNVIPSYLIPKYFQIESYKSRSIDFIKTLNIDIGHVNNLNDYKDIWNKAINKRQNDKWNWLNVIRTIVNRNQFEDIVDALLELNLKKPSWINQLDQHYLNFIARDIYESLQIYLRNNNFDDKERSYSYVKTSMIQLIHDIKGKPTKLSYEGFIPLLEKINTMLDKSFKKVLESSTPNVKISILSEESVIEIDTISFQIQIENSQESSPIKEIKVIVKSNDEIRFINENNFYPDSVKGNANCIFKLFARVSQKVIQDKATTLNVQCEYKIRNQESPVTVQDNLSLRLYSESEFNPIENPYTALADGGPVEDSNMFYGRESFIQTISDTLLNSNSKQFIIYGQKRSGKSSVLYHLKKKLSNSGKAFCVSFSVGEIIDNLTKETFFYKILSLIEEELDLLKNGNVEVPIFKALSFEEIKNSPIPADLFRKKIGQLNQSFKALNDWNQKRLVIMIDEFTYIYSAIKQGNISNSFMKEWKAITQNENAKFSVVLIGQDTVQNFKNEDYAQNAFGVIQDVRLTYLEEKDARLLIEEPTNQDYNATRFIGKSIDSILDYTSKNPYYIQIFCSRLIQFMNEKKIARVTEADIKDVAESFITGSQSLASEKFDNLIRAGEKYDVQDFQEEQILSVLRQIAEGSKNIGYCPRESIQMKDKELEERLLNHLVEREVLERKTTSQNENYKIQVRLFKEWLLNH